jgi:hypothetical protein
LSNRILSGFPEIVGLYLSTRTTTKGTEIGTIMTQHCQLLCRAASIKRQQKKQRAMLLWLKGTLLKQMFREGQMTQRRMGSEEGNDTCAS